jgi:hypothetical protein
LTAQTTYYYRVSAYTQPEMISAYASANATTLVPAAISLSASGFKVKGGQHVDLSWSGSTSVKIYRNNELITTASGSSYDDNIGSKGGATYTHQVCDTVSGACSNVTTTGFVLVASLIESIRVERVHRLSFMGGKLSF